MNSYWLYWPISYQIKAAKWLWSSMTDRLGGLQTNLAPAAMYSYYTQQYKQALAADPGFAQWMQGHTYSFQLAQMMFPITPEDLGVSLSRSTRYVGGALGLWPEYKQGADPMTAIENITNLGLPYTINNVVKPIYKEWFQTGQ
jgi:hypothetical protein